MIFKYTLAISFILLLPVSTSFAYETKPYIGLSAAKSKFPSLDSYFSNNYKDNSSSNIKDQSLGVVAGATFTKYYGIELTVHQLGSVDYDGSQENTYLNGTFVSEFAFHSNHLAIAISHQGRYPLNSYLSSYANLGVTHLSKEKMLTTRTSEKIDGVVTLLPDRTSTNETTSNYFALNFGFGLIFSFTKVYSGKLGWVRITHNSNNIDSIILNLTRSF